MHLFVAEHVRYLVLDEADKMLSLGLQPQLKRIRSLVLPRKQKADQEGIGVLVKPQTKQKRPQVCLHSPCIAASCFHRGLTVVHIVPRHDDALLCEGCEARVVTASCCATNVATSVATSIAMSTAANIAAK